MTEKSEIRKQLRARRGALTSRQREQKDRKICRLMISLIQNLPPSVVYFYYPKGVETDVREAVRWSLLHGYTVGLPRVLGEEMDFYLIGDLNRDVSPGAFQILEPVYGQPLLQEKEALCFVPGVGFDHRGMRIGQGKGYYDRYFMRYPDIKRIGVAYFCQLTVQLPSEPHDKAMDGLLTENGYISF